MSKLDLQPSRVPFLDARGEISREWRTYLQQLGTRVGGANAPTITEVGESAAQAVVAAQAAQTAAEAASDSAQEARLGAVFALTEPREKGLTLDEVVLLVLFLQQTVTNLSQELRRLRDIETYTLGG